MTVKKKRTCYFIAFLTFALLSFAIVLLCMNKTFQVNRERAFYRSTQLIQMKRGEKLAFTDANEQFGYVAYKYKNAFQVHSQGTYHLSEEAANENLDKVSNSLYIDQNGDINAVETGIYQLEYTFIVSELAAEKHSYNAHTFTALICVYEGDEGKFEPLPDDPKEMSKEGSARKNYILTKNLTWEADTIAWEWKEFYGTFINPYNYTITWKINERAVETKHTESFIGTNYGHIDNLKVKVVQDSQTPMETGFWGLVKYNYGLLQNSSIEGTVYIDKGRSFYALPKHGWSYFNQARMTVYSDGEIYPYREEYPTGFLFGLWQSQHNRVFLDAWYFNDQVKAQRRIVETIHEGDETNTCSHLVYGYQDGLIANITLKLSFKAGSFKVSDNKTIVWSVSRNTPLEIPREYWSELSWGGNGVYEAKVEYWLVNGRKRDVLSDVEVNDHMTIEPVIGFYELSPQPIE